MLMPQFTPHCAPRPPAEGATTGGMGALGAGISDDYDHEDSFIADEEGEL